MARRNKDFWESARGNNTNYIKYYNRLTELAISMFEWKNLPETVDERFLELVLFSDGMCVFFKDETLGYLALRTMIGGHLSVYQIPTIRTAYASNGYNLQLDANDSVIIFNNRLHTNSILDIEAYAKKLYLLDRVMDININAQKTPILINCDETQRLTLTNLYMQYDGNVPVIYGDKNLNPNSLKVLTTEAPYLADKLMELKTQLWNEALTYLGISNVSYQKKERMVSDEVIRNQGGTIASRYSRLKARRQAADEINKMFGLNIEVDFSQDYREADDELMFAGETADSDSKDVDTLAIDVRTN